MTSPLVNFQPQGRNTRTYQYSDTANLMVGNHALQFGGSMEQIRVNAYNFGGAVPDVTFGLSSAAPAGVDAHRRAAARDRRRGPDVGEQPRGDAVWRDLAAVADVPGRKPDVGLRRRHPEQPELEPRQLQRCSSRTTGAWKPNVTIRAGVKWEYFSPVREDDNLAFVPVLNGQTDGPGHAESGDDRELCQRRDVADAT